MRIRGKNTVCWVGLGCVCILELENYRVKGLKKKLRSNNNLNDFVSLEKETESCVKKNSKTTSFDD